MLKYFKKKKAIKEKNIDSLMAEAFANYKNPIDFMDEEEYTAWHEENSCRVCGRITCFNGSCDR